jgi:hypothetical protein
MKMLNKIYGGLITIDQRCIPKFHNDHLHSYRCDDELIALRNCLSLKRFSHLYYLYVLSKV